MFSVVKLLARSLCPLQPKNATNNLLGFRACCQATHLCGPHFGALERLPQLKLPTCGSWYAPTLQTVPITTSTRFWRNSSRSEANYELSRTLKRPSPFGNSHPPPSFKYFTFFCFVTRGVLRDRLSSTAASKLAEGTSAFTPQQRTLFQMKKSQTGSKSRLLWKSGAFTQRLIYKCEERKKTPSCWTTSSYGQTRKRKTNHQEKTKRRQGNCQTPGGEPTSAGAEPKETGKHTEPGSENKSSGRVTNSQIAFRKL